jgi:hypothetical protein
MGSSEIPIRRCLLRQSCTTTRKSPSAHPQRFESAIANHLQCAKSHQPLHTQSYLIKPGFEWDRPLTGTVEQISLHVFTQI